jgi:hypothetical protein
MVWVNRLMWHGWPAVRSVVGACVFSIYLLTCYFVFIIVSVSSILSVTARCLTCKYCGRLKKFFKRPQRQKEDKYETVCMNEIARLPVQQEILYKMSSCMSSCLYKISSCMESSCCPTTVTCIRTKKV